MNNSLSIEYALHSVINLALFPPDVHVTIKKLAGFMGVTPTYLSKIFTQLAKADIIKASVGSKGGIRLTKPPEEISFYDIFVAVNGRDQMYQCNNVRAFALGYEPVPGMCEVHQTMREAEEKMLAHLKETKISAMVDIVYRKFKPEELQAKIEALRQFMNDK